MKMKYSRSKELTFRSLRNYSADIYKETLEKISFPNYENVLREQLHVQS